MDLSELIGRLEAATEGSRELDEEISAVRDGATPEKQSDGRTAYHKDGFWVSVAVKPYTTSLDAALTLVPSWAGWNVGADHTGGQCTAEVGGQMRRGEVIITFDTEASTAPLALCIAALKARQVAKP